MSGKYVRERALASGGMATVYRGRVVGAHGFERVVAIKVMHPHLAGDAAFCAMFLDEARISSQIRHPNVVPTLDAEQGPDGLYLVMEYVDGAPLHRVAKTMSERNAPIAIPLALRIVLDALAGLHAAHELTGEDGSPLGVVHRDVSPQNILVGVDGVARIVDFGVAKASAKLTTTRTGEVKGKVAYMAVEQLCGEAVDRRSDVYAIGVVLWELLTGKRAFDGNEGQVALAVAQGRIADVREVNDLVPPAIADVCMRALRPAQNERHASAAELADALEDAAHASGVRPARPREVGQFVQEVLGVEPSSQPASLSKPPIISGAVSGPVSNEGSLVTAGPSVVEARPRTSRRWVALIAAVGAIVAVAATFFVLGRSSSAPEHDTSVDEARLGAVASDPTALRVPDERSFLGDVTVAAPPPSATVLAASAGAVHSGAASSDAQTRTPSSGAASPPANATLPAPSSKPPRVAPSPTPKPRDGEYKPKHL